jgi:4-aminobutyrate aminotransferase/4-aminobutyrate aminotransferase/(S)-3-amino-2-methylpropionate transaminase
MFAIGHWKVEPDIMTMAKALANGAPIGAFITNDRIAASYTRPGASTMGGNPVSASAALATIGLIERMQLNQMAIHLGGYLQFKLNELQQRHPLMGDVRGKGLMVGVELVREDKSPAAEEIDDVLEGLKDRGILAGKTGISRNVLTFQPPLIITLDDINRVIEALDEVLSSKQW